MEKNNMPTENAFILGLAIVIAAFLIAASKS